MVLTTEDKIAGMKRGGSGLRKTIPAYLCLGGGGHLAGLLLPHAGSHLLGNLPSGLHSRKTRLHTHREGGGPARWPAPNAVYWQHRPGWVGGGGGGGVAQGSAAALGFSRADQPLCS